MATPEQQRRTAEISRILAANGWGVIAVRDVDANVAVTARKPASAVRVGTITENMAALRFLVEQFRWTVTDYNADDVRHEATVTSL